MTSSLGLLTTLAPTPDTNLFGALTSPSALPISTVSSTGATLDYDVSASLANHTRALASQWTAAPIRAIAPLPQRNRVFSGNNNAPGNRTHTSRATSHRFRPRHMTRTAHLDKMDSRADNEGRGGEAENRDSDEDEDRDDVTPSRCFTYESITAAEGLAAWSFEELRIECYAQSLVARGTIPPPVVQLSLAIPPAFIPRVVPRNS